MACRSMANVKNDGRRERAEGGENDAKTGDSPRFIQTKSESIRSV